MQTFAMTIQKLPGGGYIMGCALDGEEITQGGAHAAASSLRELMEGIVLPGLRDHFKEAPVTYPPARPFPPPPLAMSEPAPLVNGHDVDMPDVIRRHANGYPNGTLSAIAGALMLATVWLGNMGGWTV